MKFDLSACKKITSNKTSIRYGIKFKVFIVMCI